jgi:predicted acetyltransferase
VVAPSEGRAIAEELHPRFVEPRNLTIERSAEFWKRLFEPRPPWPPPQHMGVYRNAAGEARGYVLFNVREQEDWEPGPTQYVTVRDFVWLDIDAYRGLWEFLAAHDLFREIDMERVPEDDPAMLLLLEPRTLHRRTGDAIWLRVADAELALRQRPYGAAGTLALRVVDEHFDWNDATFRIEAGEASEVSRVGGEGALTVPVARLAQLLSGYASASELARAGLIEVTDPSMLATADAMFATAYRPYCQDGF